MATDIASLQITVDSAQARNADDALDDLTVSATRADDAIEDLGNTSQRAGNKTKAMAADTGAASGRLGGFSRSAGQAGIQVQQLVGQIQGGQNAMQAFSMQAADLGIVLGAPLVGVVVSLGAVLAGTLSSAFFTAGVEAEDLYGKIEELSEGFETLTEAQKLFVASQIQDQIRDKQYEINSLANEVSKLEDNLQGAAEWDQEFSFSGSFTNAAPAVEEYNGKLEETRAALDTARQELDLLLERLNMVGEAETPDAGVVTSVQNQIDAYRQYYNFRSEARELELEQEQIAAQNQADAYEQYYFFRVQALDMARREQEITAEEAHTQKLASIYQEYAQARRDSQIAADKQAADAALKIEQNKISTTQNLQSAFTDFMESESKALFEIGKIGAAGSALNSADEAAAKALTLGPIAGPIAAGVMWAAGVARAGSILSRKFGDTSGGAAPSVPDIPAPQETNNTTTQNIQNTFNITGGNGQSIAQQIQDAVDAGELTFIGGGVASV